MANFRTSFENDGEMVTYKVESWISPKNEDKIDWSSYKQKIHKQLKQEVYNNLKNIGCDNYLVDLDFRQSGLKYGRFSYFKIVICLNKNKYFDKNYLEYLVSTFLESLNEIKMRETKKLTATA